MRGARNHASPSKSVTLWGILGLSTSGGTVIDNPLSGLPTMDPQDLYLEEVFTDRRVGTIRRLTPVGADGARDPGRPVLYSGQAQLLTAVGTLPIGFEIPATSLAEAVSQFADAAKEAVDQTLEELQQLRREAASSIIVPEAGGGGFGGPKGIPGGGKIRLR